jgi:parallel beta-helix repeat protein
LTADLYDKTIIVEKDNITLDGNGHLLLGSSTPYSTAVNISDREGVTIKNLKITSYYYGISIEFSRYNTLIGNTISDNNIVIYAEGSTDNLIFHNNFITEPNRKYGGANSWDNTIEGNYWSGDQNEDFHSGPSQNITGSDGIGDYTYIVDEDNLDSYPLMGPYYSFNVQKQGNTQYLYAISNSNITSFTYNDADQTIRFNVTANSDASEFCRICIPNVLIGESYTISINSQVPSYVNYTLYGNETHKWTYFTYEQSCTVLIEPFGLNTDINKDGIVNILDLYIVALAFRTVPGDARWDERADLDKNGIINIVDLYKVAKDWGKTTS